ncbi:hypothetical protein C8F04DRAFT_1060242 [Mycena alexandri]|uniref:Uncharacterized protein n=1 Tax=Mycena alexandri TaxID=1745969 RepID=A0AAD6TPY7_9AGAR|nr:hypothetical protein C8F04DRAFT_1060242 [Mycena alexandri]
MKFLYMLFAAIPALAVNITTFTVIGCGGTTHIFPCDGLCHASSNMRAFKVDAGAEHCVTVYSGNACQSGTLQFPTPNSEGECEPIEASQATLSFLCSVDNTCAT